MVNRPWSTPWTYKVLSLFLTQMKFLNPQFLWAFGVLAIPIIIHLFNFRRFKKVIFPNLRFLEEVQIQNKNKQQLKKWLVLAARLFALSFLVLAFAGPFIPGKDDKAAAAGNLLSVYIDNSFSMNAEGTEGELLEVAKNRARNLVNAYGETDRFQLLSNDFEGRHQRAVSKETFLQWVDELAYSARSRNLSEVFERQKNILQKETNTYTRNLAFQISDFQKSVSDLENIQGDSSIALYFIPLEANSRSNISVDSLWFDTPYIRGGEPSTLHILLKNYGSDDLHNSTVTFSVNGVQKGLAALELEAGLEKIIDIAFIPEKDGWNQVLVQIQDFPIVFDDKLYFSFEVRNSRKILHIAPDTKPSREVEAVFKTDPFFLYETASSKQLDYRSFGEYDLILVQELVEMSTGLISELKKYTEEGGSLILIPSEANPDAMNALSSSFGLPLLANSFAQAGEINVVNTDHPVYKEIIEKINERMAYPAMYRYYPWQTPASGSYENLLSTKQGVPILSLFQKGKGQVYFLSMALSQDWSSLTRHFLFPATLLQAGFRSIPGQALYYPIGTTMLVPLRKERGAKEDIIEMEGEKGVFIPEVILRNNSQFLRLDESQQSAGSFWLKKKGETERLQSVSLNYDRKESQTETWNGDELAARLTPGTQAQVMDGNAESLGKTIREMDSGKQLWKLAVFLTLLFIAIEILLLRFLKTA